MDMYLQIMYDMRIKGNLSNMMDLKGKFNKLGSMADRLVLRLGGSR